MGNGTSRGKKVAPECVTLTKKLKQDKSPLKQLNLSHTQAESHTDQADPEHQREGSRRKTAPKRTFSRSKALCHFSAEEEEEDSSPALQPEQPRVPHRCRVAFNNMKQSVQNNSPSQRVPARGTVLENVPTSEKQLTLPSTSLMPVILFDGSEETLMETIEREFG